MSQLQEDRKEKGIGMIAQIDEDIQTLHIQVK